MCTVYAAHALGIITRSLVRTITYHKENCVCIKKTQNKVEVDKHRVDTTNQVTKLSSNILNLEKSVLFFYLDRRRRGLEEYLAFMAYRDPVGFKSKSIVNLC